MRNAAKDGQNAQSLFNQVPGESPSSRSRLVECKHRNHGWFTSGLQPDAFPRSVFTQGEHRVNRMPSCVLETNMTPRYTGRVCAVTKKAGGYVESRAQSSVTKSILLAALTGGYGC